MTLKKSFAVLCILLALLGVSSAQSRKCRHCKKPSPKHTPKTRVQRTQEAFVASSDLKPMAQQLLSNRNAAAYAGVQGFAVKHNDAAGALAWFVVGYAHQSDGEFEPSIAPLRNARAHAEEVGDYVTYYLGRAYQMTGAHADAAELLKDFATRYPDSLFRRDAGVLRGSALFADNRVKEAISVLEANRAPQRADIELLLGRAYAEGKETSKAVDAFRNIYYEMPLSDEADAAEQELANLNKRGKIGEADFSQQKQRAELLFQGRRYSDSADEYKTLVRRASKEQAPQLQLAYGNALLKAKRLRDAKDTLEHIPHLSLGPQQTAQQLYLLGELTRSDEPERYLDILTTLREMKPQSTWLAEALLSAANSHLIKREYPEAIRFYSELAQRFPDAKYGSYAHWKAAWLNLRLGDTATAKQQFEEQVRVFPGGAETANALYWRARLAEEDQEYARARAYYEKLVDRYRSYYYAEVARQRLSLLPPSSQPAAIEPVLRFIGNAPRAPKVDDGVAPEDNLRVARSRLLSNGALFELAVRELTAANGGVGAGWSNQEINRLYEEDGKYHRALQVAKRLVPGYFAYETDELPRPLWEALFPRSYWDDLKRYSDDNRLDPYLVAALIRQESEFNPNAISKKNALGLMQLLPSTGRKEAREVRLNGYSNDRLLDPTVNLLLGTRYFREMVDRNHGNFEYALAAYNAGQERVDDWLQDGKYRDKAEFIESIPFTETRDYVQAIVRNVALYKRLYGKP